MLPTKLFHYRVLNKLGAGGMGEVFLAEDTDLGRKVAIKFLSPEAVADERAKKRLFREARAAAAIDHPNICAIHEVGEDRSAAFIVMQYIEGETLAGKISRAPLDLSEVLDIAVQVADALTEAHSRGIIHRDIKPANVMLTSRGQVKITDFGLAKFIKEPCELASHADTESLLSVPGAMVGTVPYMSPEQLRGGDLDPRSDIFSFGCLLYEMVAGRCCFAAESTAETVSAILTSEPPPLVRFSRQVPAQLEWIVTKALRKARQERYQTAEEMKADLKRLKQDLEIARRMGSSASATQPEEVSPIIAQTGAQTKGQTCAAHPASEVRSVPGGIKRPFAAGLIAAVVVLALGAALTAWLMRPGQAIDSLAVLPFVNASGDPDAEYLSDGITESLIDSLSQLPHLKVMSRNSVFRYKGSETDAQKAGNALGARAVLTGRVLQRGNDLLVSAELVDSRDNSHLWGERYNRKLPDILAVQEEIAKQISGKLRLRLSGEQQKRLTKHYGDNVEAYQAYLKGRFYSVKTTESGLSKAIEYFNQAIAIDLDYAPAWAGLATGYWEDSDIHVAPHEVMPKAKQAALKAIAIDDTLAEAHAALAIALTAYDWDWPNAENEFKRAIELNPNYPTAHSHYGWYLSLMQRPDEAIAEANRAILLDPLSTEYNGVLGLALHWAHRDDEAVAQFQKTLELDPYDWITRTCLSWALIAQRKPSDAIAELKLARQMDDNQYVLGALGLAYATSGNRSEALRAIDQLKDWSKQRYVSPHTIAIIYGALGENNLAFDSFDKAIQARSEHMGWLKVDSRVDPLRSDPRFAAFVRRVGLQ